MTDNLVGNETAETTEAVDNASTDNKVNPGAIRKSTTQ